MPGNNKKAVAVRITMLSRGSFDAGNICASATVKILHQIHIGSIRTKIHTPSRVYKNFFMSSSNK